MNKKTIILGVTAGMFFVNGMFAIDPTTEKEKFDINSITYIEDEIEFDLGFDTADYLPEDFDAHHVYFDLNGVKYIEEDFAMEWDSKEYLPKEFNAYAFPSDVQSINFLDESDVFEVGFDTQEYLPLNFNAFTKL
jgi:hypothetical protein